MKFKKEYADIFEAFMDYNPPCMKNKCINSCPFYLFQEIFDITCAGFCAEYPKQAAKIMNLEIIEESEDGNET